MNILPTPSGPSSRGGVHRAKDTEPGSAARAAKGSESGDGSAVEESRDRADISWAALELVGRQSAAATTELSAERLRGVLDRVASGYYDREDVRAEVIQRIARDLGTTRP